MTQYRLPVVRAHELIRALERDGWFIARTTGHHIMKHPDRPGSIPIPNHPNVKLKAGTLRGILKSAGITPERLRELL